MTHSAQAENVPMLVPSLRADFVAVAIKYTFQLREIYECRREFDKSVFYEVLDSSDFGVK